LQDRSGGNVGMQAERARGPAAVLQRGGKRVDTQQLFTLVVVIAAVGYLVRRTWLLLSGRRTGSCGSCSGCAAPADGERLPGKPLIPLDALELSATQCARNAGVTSDGS
jgi:hypothetical protein